MKTFIGEQTNSPVQLNTSDNFIIVQNPTAKSLLRTVEKILAREVRELWDEQFQESQKLDQGSESKRFLCAFELIGEKSKFCADDMRILAKCAKIEYESTSQVASQLRNLPIERQIAVLHSIDKTHCDVLARSRLRSVNWRISTSEILLEQISRGCSLLDLIIQIESGVDDWRLPIHVGEDRRDHVIMIAARIVAHFCAIGHVLAPARRLAVSGQITSKLTETYIEEFLAGLSGQRKLLTDELLKESLSAYGHETARKARVHIANFIACSDATQIGDFSSEFLSTFADCYVSKTVGAHRSNSLKEIRRVTKVVVRLCIKEYPLWPISHVSPGVIKEPRQRGKQFVWARKHEYLSNWIVLATKYVDSIPGQVTHVINSINVFLEFLVKRSSQGSDTPRTIWDLRPAHFLAEEETQELTLFDYVESLRSKKNGADADTDLGAAGRTRRCKCIHNFLDWIVRKTPGSSNPMLMDDFRFTGRLNKGRTSRIALDDSIIGALKNSIVRLEKDNTGKITNIEFPLGEAVGDIVEAFDKTEGKWVKVVWPGRAVLLYLLLSVPIRTFQARWCDSGVNDAKIYDLDSDSFIRNPDAISGVTSRHNGILREITDEATAAKFLGIWINTNKTQVVREAISGYEIPWISPDLTFSICHLRDWYLRYQVAGAIGYNTPIKYHQGENKEVSARTTAKFPSFAPLFREIRQTGSTPPYGGVIAYSRLRDFYLQALGAAEDLLSKSGRLPRRLVEWGTNDKGQRVPCVALVDLHTLRVTGITALLNRGVPPDVVAEFIAGHATALMSLYYRNGGPASLREILKKAQSEFIASQFDAEGYFRLLQDPDYADEALLSNVEDGAPDLSALYRQSSKTGIYQLTDGGSGLCPGTSCSEGAWDEGLRRPMPVEGGDGACGNCRFWRTGRIFMNGQVARMNELMYEIHKLTLTVKSDRSAVRKKRASLEPMQGDNRIKVELHQHESRLKTLEGALAAKLRDWAGRYRMLMMSNKMQPLKDGAPSAVTKTDELMAEVKETSPYVLAHWLCLQAEQSPELGVHPAAQVDLEYAIAKICDRNRLPNFLLRVPQDTRLQVANQFVEFLVASEDLIGASCSDINSLFEGEQDLKSRSVTLLLNRMEEVLLRQNANGSVVIE